MQKYILTSLFALLAITACKETVVSHGHIIKDKHLQQILVGVDNKQEVARLLGSPTGTSTFGDNRWYYYSETIMKQALKDDKTTERRIVIINFDDTGRVSKVEEKSLADGKTIEPEERITPTQGESMGIVEQMIKNVTK